MILPLLLLAHILADFTLQSNDIASGKYNSFSKLIKHLFIYFIISLAVTFYLISLELLLLIFLLTALHGIIDIIKIKVENKSGKTYSLGLFLTDQLLHIIVILAFYPVISSIRIYPVFYQIYDILDNLYPFIHYISPPQWLLIISSITIIVFNFKSSNILIEKILQKYKAESYVGSSKGRAIGNLERILVIIFVILNNYSLIGLLFTAKSLIRFKEVEESRQKDGNFVEYYLIGTFSSILIAVLSGIVINILR